MRLNRRYEQGQEFKARQGRFDFAEVALAVLEIAVSVKKALTEWWTKVRPTIAQAAAPSPMQLTFNLSP